MNALSILLMAALAAAAPETAPSSKEAPPQAGPAKDFKLPARQEFTLPNGMKVTLVPYGNVPKLDVQLALRTGNVDEKKDEVWLADLTADMLEEGTTGKTAEEMNAAAARMGGTIDTEVSADETVIVADALAEFAAPIVELVAELVRTPRFGQSEFDRIKADRLRDLAIQKSTPQALAVEAFVGTLYPNHPYGRIFPTAEALGGYQLQQVKDFYQRNYGAQRAHLYVAGKFDADALRAAIEKAFGDWAKGAAPVENVPKPVSKRAVHVLDRPSSQQSTIYMGSPTLNPSNPDWVKLQVMNALLGGSFGSRITSNIRENKGYTYSPRSTVSARLKDAYWAEVADVTTNVTGPSLKEIFGEIDKLQAAPPPDAELQSIKNYLAGTFILQNSDRGGIIGRLRFKDLHGLPDSFLENYVKMVMAVTPKDVQAMAKKIDDANMTVVVVGDRKAIEAQLRPFGKVVTLPAPK